MPKRPRYSEARVLQTLIDAGGPQLLLLTTSTTSLVLGLAVRADTWTDPYFAVEISRDQFADFVAQRFDLRYLYAKPAFKGWYLFDLADIEDDGSVSLQRMSLDAKSLRRFMPGRGIFSREFTEELTTSVLSTQDREQFNIDGSWDLPEISKFYDQYTDLYVLFNSVDIFLDEQAAIDERRRVQDAFVKPWQGGGSYTSFFGSLMDVQDKHDRLRVGAIQYNSPGFVDVRGKAEPFKEVRALVEHYSANREKITEEYNGLHKWLSNNELLTLAAPKFDKSGDLAKEVNARAKKYAATLQAMPYADVLRMSQKDPLIAAKVLLAVYRRLAKLYEFFLQGRVAFSQDASASILSTDGSPGGLAQTP